MVPTARPVRKLKAILGWMTEGVMTKGGTAMVAQEGAPRRRILD